jgi:hypothetical protein
VILQVVLRGKGLPGGKLVARRDWSVVELLMASPPPPTTWLGVQAVRESLTVLEFCDLSQPANQCLLLSMCNLRVYVLPKTCPCLLCCCDCTCFQ